MERRPVVVDAELNAWATALKMIQAGVRPPVVHLATGLAKTKLRELYQEVHGRPAPRGRVPENAYRLITSVAEAMEALAFGNVYRYLAGPQPKELNQKLDSSLVLDAYQVYREKVAVKPLDVTTAWYLARDIRNGTIVFRKCRQCHTEYLYDLRSPFLRCCLLCRRSH